MGSMMLGLDYVAGGQLAALPKFKEEFGVVGPHGSYIVPARYLSAWASIGPACDIVAALIAVPFLEKYGRKPQILVASVLSAVGVLLQQLATEWKMHLAGRAVNGQYNIPRKPGKVGLQKLTSNMLQGLLLVLCLLFHLSGLERRAGPSFVGSFYVSSTLALSSANLQCMFFGLYFSFKRS